MLSNGGTLAIGENFTAIDNVAAAQGGGIYLELDINFRLGAGALLSSNRAGTDGGALYSVRSYVVANDGLSVVNNTAGRGGGCFFQTGNFTFGCGLRVCIYIYVYLHGTLHHMF
jgi:predicted outer membrane repeat protein